MVKEITKDDLQAWVEEYTMNLQDVNETRSCLLKIEEVEELLSRIRSHNTNNQNPRIGGLRIHFIRSEALPCPRPHEQIKKIDGGGIQIPQLSCAIVPISDFKVDNNQNWIANDFFEGDETFGIIPGDRQGSGHNPPGPDVVLTSPTQLAMKVK